MCVGMVNGNADELGSSQSWDWFQSRISDLGHPSMTQFAETHGFPKSSLSRYFHRERQVPSGTIGPLCQALQVSPQELLSALGAIDWQESDRRLNE